MQFSSPPASHKAWLWGWFFSVCLRMLILCYVSGNCQSLLHVTKSPIKSPGSETWRFWTISWYSTVFTVLKEFGLWGADKCRNDVWQFFSFFRRTVLYQFHSRNEQQLALLKHQQHRAAKCLLHHQNIAKCKQCFTVCCNRIIPWRKVFEYFLFGTFITNTDIFRPFAKCCLFFFTFPLCKSLDGVFAERSWRTWEMGRASKKGQSLRFEKISCTIWLKKIRSHELCAVVFPEEISNKSRWWWLACRAVEQSL